MHRGYLKWWRRAEESCVWSRGIEYRGLLITLLTRANYKETSFGGEKVLPGQVAVSIQRLADDLGISRDKLNRMLRNLQKDGVISSQNSHNRYTIITICNFMQYQECENNNRTTDTLTNHTTPAQPPHTSKEGKNKNNTTSYEVVVASGAADDNPPEKPNGKIPDCPHQQIIQAYHEILPEFPRVKIWEGQRSKNLSARWKQAFMRKNLKTAEQGINYFRSFFEYIRGSPFLMGETTKPFRCSLGWIVTADNYRKIVEENYHGQDN